EGYLQRQVKGWTDRWERARTKDVPAAAEVVRWLNDHMPPSPPPTLVHNDWRLDNMAVASDDPGRCVAVYDWDMCTVGDPFTDVGTLLASWFEAGEEYAFLASMPSRVPGFMTRAEAIARYGERSGRDVGRMPYYYVFGLSAMAVVSAECGRTMMGAYVLNCHAPDEGNMHTLLHHATAEQKERYLRPLVDGRVRSCFAMTEPEVAGSDPTGIRTAAVRDGDHWVLNGHKWFISGARGAAFAIVIAKTDPDAQPPQARNTAFLVDADAPGWTIVRDVETMAGHGNHCEIRLEDVRVSDAAILGGRGQGHRLGQARLGPARLAHCMRWI